MAKYFALIPAMCAVAYPGLETLNVMRLHRPTSAIASAIIFNALVIVALIPLALRGVRYRPSSAEALLRPGPGWFQPRPSADGYDPLASGASKLGPNNPELVRTVRRRAVVAAFDGGNPGDVPVDAVTASGSGLDPHISPGYAYQQVNRVAETRGPKPATVRCLVAGHVRDRVLGQERVNVVELNFALADRT